MIPRKPFGLPANLKIEESSGKVQEILNVIITAEVNDFYLAIGRTPFCRRQGFLSEVQEVSQIDEDIFNSILGFLLQKQRVDEAKQALDSKRAFHFSGSLSQAVDGINHQCRYRAILVNTLDGPELTVRVLDRNLLALDQIGLQDAHYLKLSEMLRRTKGLILVTGPTGAGKSTTLAAMIQHLIDHYTYHVITLEDPIEFILAPSDSKARAFSLVTQRTVGVDCASYQDGLLDALRMKPEVIAIGEVRDAETMRTVINAAETGHLIIGTMHASTTFQAIDRILTQAGNDARMISQMLANNLLCILSQNLLPSIDSTEAAPKRVLCCEAVFQNREMSKALFNHKAVSPEQMRSFCDEHEGISWNRSLDNLIARGSITAEASSMYRSQEYEQ